MATEKESWIKREIRFIVRALAKRYAKTGKEPSVDESKRLERLEALHAMLKKEREKGGRNV